MALLLAFAITLFVASLLSDWAKKTILSTAVLFLGAGLLIGSHLIPKVSPPGWTVLRPLAEVALFSVLFTDGMRTGGLREIRRNWHLPGRALLLGLPLTIVLGGALAHWLANLAWIPAFLIAAALSPTDPVFVSAIFAIENISDVVKRTLNIESGLNDGLALPVVLVLLTYVTRAHAELPAIVGELALGVLIGIAIPWIGIRLEATSLFSAVGVFRSLFTFSLGLLVLAVCYATGGNLFLGAFCAGITTASLSDAAVENFRHFGESVAELLKLAALLVLGAIMGPRILQHLSWKEGLFLLAVIFAVRPMVMLLAFFRSGLPRHQVLTIGWFGPKGFASVVYGLLVFEGGVIRGAHLVAMGTLLSILVFSSTDILVGKWFAEPTPDTRAEAESTNRAA